MSHSSVMARYQPHIISRSLSPAPYYQPQPVTGPILSATACHRPHIIISSHSPAPYYQPQPVTGPISGCNATAAITHGGKTPPAMSLRLGKAGARGGKSACRAVVGQRPRHITRSRPPPSSHNPVAATAPVRCRYREETPPDRLG